MRRRERAGFTLTEMLVVISIIGIAASMSIALAAGFLRGNKVALATRMVQAGLMEARSRAIASKLNTSMVLYRLDSMAVLTNEKWEPIGQPIVIPDPCYFMMYEGQDYLPAGWYWNRIAPLYDIMTITFESTGTAVKNLPAAQDTSRVCRVGAIFVTIVDPSSLWYNRGGSVTADSGNELELSGGYWTFSPNGYVMVGSEFVSYNTLGSTPAGYAKLSGLQRNLFGSGTSGSLVGKSVYLTGFCGNIMVIGSTGQVITVLL